jgi:hypothetical protein
MLDVTLVSDEVCFHFTGYVNSDITYIWSMENPHAVHDNSLLPVKIWVWCAAVSHRSIVGHIPPRKHHELRTSHWRWICLGIISLCFMWTFVLYKEFHKIKWHAHRRCEHLFCGTEKRMHPYFKHATALLPTIYQQNFTRFIK